jgi:hypothetical protein
MLAAPDVDGFLRRFCDFRADKEKGKSEVCHGGEEPEFLFHEGPLLSFVTVQWLLQGEHVVSGGEVVGAPLQQ